MHKIRSYLLKNHIAPKWMVYIFDTIIGVVSILIAAILANNFDPEFLFTEKTMFGLALILLTNSLFFYVFKTYEGIIRFSGFAEAIRTTAALFGSFICLLFLNLIMLGIERPTLIPFSILVINLLASSFLMVGYRLLVKSLYKSSITNSNTVNVVIYGSEVNGSKMKNTLEESSNYKYRVVAFIDDDFNYIGKTIDNVRIFSFHQIKDLMKSWNIGLLIFAKSDLKAEEKNDIVDYCLEHEIAVRNLPPLEQWLKGSQNLTQLKEIKIEELLGRPLIRLQNEKVVEMVKCKRVLVTGAAGSIGCELARQIASIEPTLLILCDQNESGLFELEYALKNDFPGCENVVVFVGDVRDENAMEALFDRFRPTIVYHAAAYKHVPMMENHAAEAVRNNVQGTRVLADLSIEYGVERFLLISTDKAINPTNVMGATKRVAEIYVQSLGSREKKVIHLNQNHKDAYNEKVVTKFITTRFGNVLGSNGSVIPRFKEQIARGGPVTVTHPDIIRYFMTITEACNLVLEASAMGEGGEVFLFDMGAPVKIVDLARKMIKLAGYNPNKDIEIKFCGLRPGEKLYEELLNEKEQVIKTHHKKILIAKVVEYDFYKINKSIDILISHAKQSQDDEVVRQMKRIIPEYISNNSTYQAIDKENLDEAILAVQ